MFILSEKAIEILKNNSKLRFVIASEMGNGEEAVKRDIRTKNGKNIANHYGALNRLIDETGMTTHDLRVEVPTPQKKIKVGI